MALPEVVLALLAEALSPGVALGVLGPEGALLSPRAVRLRADASPDLHPKLVVCHPELAGALWSTHPSIRTATVVFSKEPSAVTRFFTWPGGGMSAAEVRADFATLLRREGGTTAHGFVHRGSLDPAAGLRPEAWAPLAQAQLAELATIGEVRPLGDLFQILRGLHPGADRAVLFPAETTEKGAFVVDGLNLTPEGIDYLSARHRAEVDPERLLRPGDLLLREISRPRGTLVVARVDEEDPALVAGRGVIVLRPTAVASETQVQVARLYLASAMAHDLLTARLSSLGGTVHLSAGALAELPMPVPDMALSSALGDLNGARAQLERWAREIDEHISDLFGRGSVRETLSRTFAAGRRTRERVSAARRVDELAFRVRTLFPHPIAYRWRSVEAATPDREGYRAILDAAEVTLCYLATMGVVQARALEYEIGYLGTIRNNLADGKGTSFGDWIAICDEVSGSRELRRAAYRAPVPELLELFRNDEEARRSIATLKRRRDDEAHGRPVEAHLLADAAREAEADLVQILSAVEFLADYPLRYVELTQRDSLRRRMSYTYRELVGDHPLVGMLRAETDSSEVEAGSLYFVGRDGALHLLRPLLLRLQCPQCGSWATFHVDRFDSRQKRVLMKALEHGHTVERPDLVEPLRLMGILSASKDESR
jgi:hypothetical protein